MLIQVDVYQDFSMKDRDLGDRQIYYLFITQVILTKYWIV